MAKCYPKRKLSTEDIWRALNFDSDSDDSNDKLEKLLREKIEHFLKSCTVEVRVPRGRVPRGLTVMLNLNYCSTTVI